MNEQYTIEELGLGRSKSEHIEAVYDCIIAEDIVCYKDDVISSDIILDSLGEQFKRRLMHLVMDSQSPVSSDARNEISDKIMQVSNEIVNNIDPVF